MSAYKPISRDGIEAAEPLDFAEPRRITISTDVLHHGRKLTITCAGYSVDEFCTMLDTRFGQVEHTAPQTSALPTDGPPTCPVHNREMKEMKFPKAGARWFCTAKTDDDHYCTKRA
jgi:hypothetical protein